jgi:carnitine 3-dehydrogenase
MSDVRKVGLIGAGVIGAGWAARLVLNGLDVALYDPDPEAPRKVSEVLANAGRAYGKLTLAPLGEPGRLEITTELGAAVADADFIQESAPERLELKQDLLARASRACRPEVVIASSTSGLLPSRLQERMAHPERLVVGHPFNPVYLLPLVEVCGGALTSEEAKARAADLYRALGMRPLVLGKAIDGFIADRLMEALWREALWLVNDDIATAEEIDDAIRFGAGLRWAFMGPFLTYRIAGGEAGMRHFMAQFGPSLRWPWSRLTDVPELTDDLLDKLVAQSDAQAAGRSIRELERLRDDCLVAVIQGLRSHGFAAGEVLRAYEDLLLARAHPGPMAAEVDIQEPLRLHTARVLPEWLDYNGHMTESRYLQVFGDASDALTAFLGVDADYRATHGSYFTVETHIMHLREVDAEVPLHVTTQVLGCDDKRLHVFHSLIRGDVGTRLATAEQMLLHVAAESKRAGRAGPEVLERARRIAEAHAHLPQPDLAGRRVGAARG